MSELLTPAIMLPRTAAQRGTAGSRVVAMVNGAGPLLRGVWVVGLLAVPTRIVELQPMHVVLVVCLVAAAVRNRYIRSWALFKVGGLYLTSTLSYCPILRFLYCNLNVYLIGVGVMQCIPFNFCCPRPNIRLRAGVTV